MVGRVSKLVKNDSKNFKQLKLSIIVPVYNEEKTIEQLLRKVLNCGYSQRIFIRF